MTDKPNNIQAAHDRVTGGVQLSGGAWDQPDSDPVADIQNMLTKAAHEAFTPDLIIVPWRVWVELKLSVMDFGWWPMSWFRKRAARKWLLANEPTVDHG